jgi:Gas vesicle protein
MSRRPPRTPPLPRTLRPPAPRTHPAPPPRRGISLLPARREHPHPPHPSHPPTVARILDEQERTLLDVVDSLLNRGVVVNGEVLLSLAGVDLIYLQLSVLLVAADRLFTTSRKKVVR